MDLHLQSVLIASLLFASSGSLGRAGQWPHPGRLTNEFPSAQPSIKVALLDPPQLVAPADGDTNRSTWGTLVWRGASGATHYHLQMSPDSLFATLLLDDSTLTDTSAAYRVLPTTRYYWKVRALDGITSSAYSPAWSFTTWKQPYRAPAPPQLAPPNGCYRLADTITISWGIRQRGEVYHLQVLTSGHPVVDDSAYAGTSYRCLVEPGRRYIWGIRSTLATVWSAWSDTWYFLTQVKAPVLIAPAKDTVGISREVTFRWHSVPGAPSYNAHVAEDTLLRKAIPGFGATGGDTVITGIIPAGLAHVYWNVRASGVPGTSNESSVWHFTTGQWIPVLVTPSDGAPKLSTSPELSWESVTGAHAYRVQMAQAMSWDSTRLLIDTTLSDTCVVIHGLDHSTGYAWRVGSVTLEGPSAFSPARWFRTVDEEIAPPSLLLPADGATLMMAPVTFVWNKPMPDATRYWFELSPDSTFHAAVTDTTLADTSWTVTGITIGPHYWRVRAGTPADWGPYSPAFRFTVGYTSADGRDGLPTAHSLDQNYPNPFNPTTEIRFGLPEASDVRLAVYNVLGQEIRVLVRTHVQAGYHHVRFDGMGLPTGVYIYRLEAGRFVAARMLMIVH